MHESSSLLHTAEVVHWAALITMAAVYSLRLRWLFNFKPGADKSAPGAPHRTDKKRGANYSLFNVAMPWSMESTRKGFAFYLTFVIFHLGVVAGISLAFLSTITPSLVGKPAFALICGSTLFLAFLVAIYRVFRRLFTPVMRLISTPDDYFSLFMLTVWFGLGVVTEAHLAGVRGFESVNILVAYLFLTSFFLIYVPFSKISHYLYYPFTRIWIGRALGHRGSYPIVRG
jgi:nitrate reductase gamma subunit